MEVTVFSRTLEHACNRTQCNNLEEYHININFSEFLKNLETIGILDFNRLEIIHDFWLHELFGLAKRNSFKIKVKALLPYFQTAPLYCCPFHV